ncbi:BQ2448_7093 [Microbotryum intermedium]|uniref:BQ2448_7093 protein n=1 Tax=Microbotryum intermedium TaxID=269621 RepID=A0A238FPN5_9BASI|nr:BQ2448_7093 [Microbotryum intermedium]
MSSSSSSSLIVKAEMDQPLLPSLAKRITTSSTPTSASAHAEGDQEMKPDREVEDTISDDNEADEGADQDAAVDVNPAASSDLTSPSARAQAHAASIPGNPILDPTSAAARQGTQAEAEAPPPTVTNTTSGTAATLTPFVSTNPNWRPPARVDCALCKGGAAPTPVDSWDFLRAKWHKVLGYSHTCSPRTKLSRLTCISLACQTCSLHHKPTKSEYTSFQDLLDRLETRVEHKIDQVDLEAGFLVPELSSIGNVYLIPDLRNLLKPLATTFISRLSLSSRWHFVYKDAIPTSRGLKFRYTCSQTSRNDRPRDGKKARKTPHKREGGRVEKFPCGGIVTLIFDMTSKDVVVHLVHKKWHVAYEKTRVVDRDVLEWVRELVEDCDTHVSMMNKLEKRARERVEGEVKSTAYQIRRYMSICLEERRLAGGKAKELTPASQDENEPGPSTGKRARPPSPPPVDPALLALSTSQTPEPASAPPRPKESKTRRRTNAQASTSANTHPSATTNSTIDVNVGNIPTNSTLPLASSSVLDGALPSSEPTSPSTTTADDSVNAAMSIILGTNHQPSLDDIQVVIDQQGPLANPHHAATEPNLDRSNDLPVNPVPIMVEGVEGSTGATPTLDIDLANQLIQADWNRQLRMEDEEMVKRLHQANVDATLQAAAREVRENGGA